MKKLLILLLTFILTASSAYASGWWDDWRDDRYKDRYDGYSSDYEEGYEEGYNEGFDEGTANPFYDESDKAAAFGDWFLYEEWTEQELHAWKSVFEALFDDLDRTPYPKQEEIKTPVYIAYITGSTYHKSSECSYLSNAYSILELDETEAVSRGFSPCRRCK